LFFYGKYHVYGIFLYLRGIASVGFSLRALRGAALFDNLVIISYMKISLGGFFLNGTFWGGFTGSAPIFFIFLSVDSKKVLLLWSSNQNTPLRAY
jgi:hypothetical protein